jgi:hypothetical protein
LQIHAGGDDLRKGWKRIDEHGRTPRVHTFQCEGARVSNKSLTVVLPVYNGATRLRASVREILELASELTSRFGILIVDDGSTDATLEVAEELAARYPQIEVRRHRYRCGLGPTIEFVQRTVRSDAVMLHDGVTPIDLNQMRNEWKRWLNRATNCSDGPAVESLQSEVCDFANLPAIHAAMERAHGRLVGFQLITPQVDASPESLRDGATTSSRPDPSHTRNKRGVGNIPRLPRPKFLSALAQFALGE